MLVFACPFLDTLEKKLMIIARPKVDIKSSSFFCFLLNTIKSFQLVLQFFSQITECIDHEVSILNLGLCKLATLPQLQKNLGESLCPLQLMPEAWDLPDHIEW
jgi:hypothetical protein